MGHINVGRAILGGLLTGVVINIGETILNVLIVAEPMERALQARNLPPVGGAAIGGFVLLCFLLGIATVWLYAAIRPRFGPGVRTAVIVGVVVWWFAFVWPGIGDVIIGFVPPTVSAIVLAWEAAEIIIGSVAGAWLYREA